MPHQRQQLLVLCLAAPDLESSTVAWSLYDGARPVDDLQPQTGDDKTPPYASVLRAMQDGWRVIQVPSLPTYIPGHEHETTHLPYEYILERMVTVDGE
jgi:hypothetical protein